MKTEELMIGDWVMFPKMSETPMRIEGIFSSSQYYFVLAKPNFGILHFNPDYIVPVPLTPEILEKNGIEIDNGGAYVDDSELEISVVNEEIFWSINGNEYSILRLKYVHELQHALRLCGCNKEIDL